MRRPPEMEAQTLKRSGIWCTVAAVETKTTILGGFCNECFRRNPIPF